MAKFRDTLNKRYGNRVTRTDKPVTYEVIPTGSLELDVALRVGGWVRGRTHELVGQPGCCKSSLSAMSAAEHQKAIPDKAIGWIDMEQSFDFGWAESLGLDTSEDRFTHFYPDFSEHVADMGKIMSRSELYSMIVIDSIGGMESKVAFEKDAEDVVMGKNAQVITKMAKQLAVLARENNITVLYVNQLRADLSGRGFDKAAGPKALGYSTTTSVTLARKGGLADSVHFVGTGENREEVGRLYVAKVQRSRVAAQGRKAEFWFSNQPSKEFGPVGIDRVDEAVGIGLRMGVIKQGGAYYTPPGYTKPIKSRDALVAKLRKDPGTVEEIRRQALASVSGDVNTEIETEFELEGSDG